MNTKKEGRLRPSWLVMLTHSLSPLVTGSAQNPRMNPCPSARPGEGEQEENRQGGPPGLAATAGSEDRGMQILFLLGVPGQSPRTPGQKDQSCRAATIILCARDGSRKAETRNPACGISRGSVHDSPAGAAGRAGADTLYCNELVFTP
jgi:hypothetical protein